MNTFFFIMDKKLKAFVLYAAKVLKANENNLEEKLRALSKDEFNLLVESFNELYKQMENEKSIFAKLGSKLNFIKKLNNKCPEGYEVEMYLKGGKACTRCKKKPMIQEGGSIKEEIALSKCGKKMKKSKKK